MQRSKLDGSTQGLTAREAAQAAVAIRWPRPMGILETRGPKPNAVACPRGVAFCAASRRCQHVSIATVAAVPLVPSRRRPRPYAPMERSSWRAAQATRRIFASWGVRHPGVGSSECVGIYRISPPLLTRPPRESIESLRLGSPRRGEGFRDGRATAAARNPRGPKACSSASSSVGGATATNWEQALGPRGLRAAAVARPSQHPSPGVGYPNEGTRYLLSD